MISSTHGIEDSSDSPKPSRSEMIHPSAEVSPQASIGERTKIWHHVQVREGAVIGYECIIGKGVYIDFDVRIGDRCKLQNGAYVYHGVTVGNGVFLGPGVLCLNDKIPRAVNPDGTLKTDANWEPLTSEIGDGASVGGGAIIMPGVNIGRWAMVGGGSVVTRDIPDHGLVYGNPAHLHGFVCKSGDRMTAAGIVNQKAKLVCPRCEEEILVSISLARGIDSKPS